MNVLFIGDIFGKRGRDLVIELLSGLKEKHNIDFVIAQGENVTNRKGLNKDDYLRLKNAGINAFTMGNHVWADPEILELMRNDADIVRPYNTHNQKGEGSKVFKLKDNSTIRVTSLMGKTFNKLFFPWQQRWADNFFDAMDNLIEEDSADYHFVDFHAETTSEKNVLSLYLDGKINAIVGTHTHVQTNDNKTMQKGTAYITDVGMTGPANCAIGANYDEVYKRMRFDKKTRFIESDNVAQFNAVVITMSKDGNNTIKKINIPPA